MIGESFLSILHCALLWCNMMRMNRGKTLQQTAALIVAVALMLCLGLIYAWSVFVLPLEEEFGWTRDRTSLTFMISMICFCVGGVASGRQLSRGRSFRTLLFIAAALMAAGFIAAAFTSRLVQFYLSYGVLCGFGVGMGYNAIISFITKRFRRRSGTVSGLLMVGFGLGAMAFGILCTNLMELFGWRALFVGIGAIFGPVFALGAVLLARVFKDEPSPCAECAEEDADVTAAGAAGGGPAEAAANAARDSLASPDVYGAGLAGIIRRPEFWLLFCWIFLFGSCGLALIGNVAPVAVELGAGAALAAIYAGVISLFNGVGRLIVGACLDRYGYKKVAAVVSFGFLASVALILASLHADSLPLFFAACCLTGFCFSALPISCASFIMKRYGPDHFAENFAAGNTNMIVQAVIGSGLFASYLVHSASSSEGFMLLVPLAVAGTVVYFLLVFSLQKSRSAIPPKTDRGKPGAGIVLYLTRRKTQA
jgi:OFA family oxalate/formate antiporter-like MFS transporter